VQAIDLRPLRRDSVAFGGTTLDGDGTRRDDRGRAVSCGEGDAWCVLLAAGPRIQARPMLHDLSLAAWGFGQGVSFHGSVRLRDDLGGTAGAWPRLDDRFDALEAFLEVDRERGRARLGRQWALNVLGATSFDGASLLLRGDRLTIEAYGGRALVQGLNEPYTSPELGTVDDLPPDDQADLLGARLRVRMGTRGSLHGIYQRTVRRDRAGLVAERASLSANWSALGTAFQANLVHDVAANLVNELQLRASRTLRSRVDIAVEGRRTRPFFELWTIWGAFAPVGFDEARTTVSWRPASGDLSLLAAAGYRAYEATDVGLDFAPLRSDGWRASVDGHWTPSETFAASASYGVDVGVGASQSDASVGARWELGSRLDIGLAASALQSIYEFRVGSGRVFGAVGHGGWRLGGDTRLRLEGGVYRHVLDGDALGQNWSQRRASVRLEWALGADPGSAR
jgi:hypothetical protein